MAIPATNEIQFTYVDNPEDTLDVRWTDDDCRPLELVVSPDEGHRYACLNRDEVKGLLALLKGCLEADNRDEDREFLDNL